MPDPTTVPDALRQEVETAMAPLEGWCSLDKALHLVAAILDLKPRTVVEIGAFGGKSVVPMALALRHLNNGAKLYAIDPWRPQSALEGETDPANLDWWTNKVDLHTIHRGFMEAVWFNNLDSFVVTLRADSQHTYHLFKRIGLLHIDGCHGETASTRDVTNYVPLVPKGGLIFFDDADWPSTAHAIELLSKQATLLGEIKGANVCQVYSKESIKP